MSDDRVLWDDEHHQPKVAANPHLTLSERAAAQFPPGFSVYRVQDAWRVRRGVVIRGPRRWWMRTWQSEWDGAPRAYRAFTRNGALIRGVRAAAALPGDEGDDRG